MHMCHLYSMQTISVQGHNSGNQILAWQSLAGTTRHAMDNRHPGQASFCNSFLLWYHPNESALCLCRHS